MGDRRLQRRSKIRIYRKDFQLFVNSKDSTINIEDFQAKKRGFTTLLIFDDFDRIFFNICRRRSIISSKQHEIFQKRVLCHLKLSNMASS